MQGIAHGLRTAAAGGLQQLERAQRLAVPGAMQEPLVASKSMRITPQLLDEIVAHARETAPQECCGVVTGVDGTAAAVERAENEFAHAMRYRISADEMFRIYKLAEVRGEEMLAFYHSHPRSEAYPSQTDINEAGGLPESLHLICSLENPDRPVIRAFAIRGSAVEEAALDGP